MNGSALGLEVMAYTMGYENRLFDNTKVHTIDIVMNDWDEFIDNATSEEYYSAAVVIDGEAYKNVAIRGKGNTSLSTVSSLGSERYSFKIEFDHYDNSITYHGLDKLSLNNLIQDSTMMKDYLTYTMMNEFGAAAPLCSFVYITVNGEDWGLYLAIEGVEDSFLERNYGSDYGELYKPDSMGFGGGRGNGRNFNMDDFMNSFTSSKNFAETNRGMMMPNKQSGNMPDMSGFDPSQMQGGLGGNMPQMPGMLQGGSASENENPSSIGGRINGFSFGGMGGFGRGSSDVNLQYVDDSIDSYSSIWSNAKTDITEADQYRLIESLKKLSYGEQIESVVDIEQVIRYFVVHNYVCNGDSYTGSMVHNYYLYEENGQLAMLPWDYNLAFGTFQGGNAQSIVNTPIDAPVSGGSSEDRPMWKWILSNEIYTELYHQYFVEFLNTVDIAGIIDNTYNLIKSYAEKDPTAFYNYEDFEAGVETMRLFCMLRSESISMQLETGETTSNMNYVDASGLTLSDMGSMGMGGGRGGFGGERQDGFDMSGFHGGVLGNRWEGTEIPRNDGNTDGNSSGLDVEGTSATTSEGMPQNGGMPEKPEGFASPQMPGRFPGQSAGGTETTPSGDSETSDNTGSFGNRNHPSGGNIQMPGGNFGFGMNNMETSTEGVSGWIWIAVSVLILGVGLIIAKVYKH